MRNFIDIVNSMFQPVAEAAPVAPNKPLKPSDAPAAPPPPTSGGERAAQAPAPTNTAPGTPAPTNYSTPNKDAVQNQSQPNQADQSIQGTQGTQASTDTGAQTPSGQDADLTPDDFIGMSDEQIENDPNIDQTITAGQRAQKYLQDKGVI